MVTLNTSEEATTGTAIAISVFAIAVPFNGGGELTSSVRVMPSPLTLCKIIM